MNQLDNLLPLSPSLFFTFACDILYASDLDFKTCFKRFFLPNLEEMCHEEHFAKMAASWHENGMTFAIEVNHPFTKSDYPNYERTDAIELLIDTRGIENAQIFHRFCHHFVILSAKNHDVSALEITRFRQEERHELADPKDIQVKREFSQKKYQVKVHLPSHILHGYDPSEFKVLKFFARIHRAGGNPNHFGVSSKDYQVMTTPLLWTSLNLKKGKK